MSIRRLAFFTLILAACAAAGLSLYRSRLEAQALAALDQWAADQRAQGRVVAWDSATASGFPVKIRIDLTQPSVQWPGGARWRAETASLWAWVFAPHDLHVDMAGHMAALNAAGGIALSARADNAALRLHAGGFDFHAHRLNLGDASVADMAASLDAPQSGERRFAITARDISPADDMRVAMAEISGRIRGDAPAQLSVAEIARWSNAGGSVDIDRVALEWPPAGLEGDGAFALDGTGTPVAAFSLRMRGAPALLDHLAQTGVMDPSTASAVGMAAALMAKPDQKGRPTLTLPVSVQDGGVYLGAVRAAELPSIPWADFAGR